MGMIILRMTGLRYSGNYGYPGFTKRECKASEDDNSEARTVDYGIR